MDDWRDRILKEFTPKIAPLTLVADPDGLLLEESLLEVIREREFEILPFDDSVAFRFAYESPVPVPPGLRRERRARGRGARRAPPTGDHPALGPAAHQPAALLRSRRAVPGPELPGGRLARPWPSRRLAPCMDAAWGGSARRRRDEGLRAAARLRDRARASPAAGRPAARPSTETLPGRAATAHPGRPPDSTCSAAAGHSNSWPLEAIVPSRDAFFSFLQERWPLFLDRLVGNAGDGPRDVSGASDLALEGPRTSPSITTMSASTWTTCSSKECSPPYLTRRALTYAANGRRWGSETTRGRPAAPPWGLDGSGRHHDSWPRCTAFRMDEVRLPLGRAGGSSVGDGRAGAVRDGNAVCRSAGGGGSDLSRLDRAPLRGPPQPAAGPAGDGSSPAALPREAT